MNTVQENPESLYATAPRLGFGRRSTLQELATPPRGFEIARRSPAAQPGFLLMQLRERLSERRPARTFLRA